MPRYSIPLAVGLVALLLPAARGADGNDAVLKAKGLRRAGTSYVLPAEAELQKRLNEARRQFQNLNVLVRQKQSHEQAMVDGRTTLDELERQRIELNQQLSLDLAAADHNRLVSMVNALNGQINLLSRQVNDPDARQYPGARLAMYREEYFQTVLDLRELVDRSTSAYESVVKDPEVVAAVAALNAAGKTKFTLGPTKTFLANVATFAKVEASVLSETVRTRKEGGVHWVDATFNGKTVKPLVFDTGASTVVLPAEFAAQIGANPAADAPPVKVQVADGSEVTARKVVIPSIRVGKFTVKDVEALVMPADKANVPPLLGQTFLRHFTYKFTPDANALVLTKVETPETPGEPPTRTRTAKGKRARNATPDP